MIFCDSRLRIGSLLGALRLLPDVDIQHRGVCNSTFFTFSVIVTDET